MATLNYIVKGKKFYSNILIRFKNGRNFDYTASTEFKIEPKNWSQAKQKIKNTAADKTKDEMNNHLIELKKFIIDSFNLDNAAGIYIDKEWLMKIISSYFNRPLNDSVADEIFFVPFVDKFIKLAPNRLIRGKNKAVSSSTITKYNSLSSKLKEYETHAKTKIKFTDLDLNFYSSFVNFLRVNQTIGLNTVGKYISTLKGIAREALLQGFPVHNQINHPNFFAPTEKTEDIYLTDEEIKIIYNHDFKDNDRLDNARDLFIIGLRTGLRISDFNRLKETNIINGFIEIETQKTEDNAVIPMHPQVKAILEKRGGFPKAISDQKFNLYIKDVCEEAKLKEMISGSKINPKTNRKEKGIFPKHKLVTSHICSRSFATNLYGKLPNMVIMAITTHKTETQFLRYIKVTPKENAEILKDYWNKQEEEQSNKEN